MHSLLLVPVDDPVAREAARSAPADCIVLDCAEPSGRRDSFEALWTDIQQLITALRQDPASPQIFLRFEGIDDPTGDAAVAAAVAAGLDGLYLAGCRTPADVQQLGAMLAVQEAENDVEDGSTSIIAEVASAAALLALGPFAGCSTRLVGLGWDAARLAEDLGLAIACAGALPAPLATARHLVLFAARAADVAAVDTISLSSDDAALEECRVARQIGFNAKLARSASACAAINAAFGTEDGPPSG